MGAHIGKGAEIMQLVWLDHFRPELIFIGDYTLLGACTQLTVHAYEGSGKFRYGIIEIGNKDGGGGGDDNQPISSAQGEDAEGPLQDGDIKQKDKDGALRISEDNLDECVLCDLCIEAAPNGGVEVVKLYE